MTSFSVINLIMSRKFDLILDEKPSFSELSGEVARRGFHAFPALLMPVIILGGIYGGVMTPTEAAAVAVIYAVPVGFLIYKGLRWENFFSAGKEAATAVGAIMMMILFSMILSQMFVYESIPQQLVQGIFSITENKVLLLIMINIMLFPGRHGRQRCHGDHPDCPATFAAHECDRRQPGAVCRNHGRQYCYGRCDATLCLDPVSGRAYRQREGDQGHPTSHETHLCLAMCPWSS